MAQALASRGRAFGCGAAPRPGSAARPARAASVSARAAEQKKEQVPLAERLAPTLLAAVVALSSGLSTLDAVRPPVALADEEEEFMSPYQKRQAEMERRRELLREAREKAAARASGGDVPAAQPAASAEPEKPSSDFAAQAQRLKQGSLKAYESAAKNRPPVPATPAPEPEESPLFGGFSFSKPAEAPAPAAAPAPAPSSSFATPPDPWRSKPAPVTPAPAPPAPAPAPAAPRPVVPVPVPVPVPAPVKKVEAPKPEPKAEVKKAAPAPASKKRRGPLPLWFAEVLVLGSYVGLGLAATKYSKESGELLKVVGAKVVELYTAAEKAIASKA